VDKDTEKSKGGRPPHTPTETTSKQVERMAAIGLPETDIATVIGITAPTLRRHYRKELDIGLAKANLAVATNLFRQATKDDPRSFPHIKFWLNCRAGWSEYAPPPPPRPEPLGKKQVRQLEAETAEQGTTWGDVLAKPGDSIN
jgi:hypothetical protein